VCVCEDGYEVSADGETCQLSHGSGCIDFGNGTDTCNSDNGLVSMITRLA